jgi:hypothetical protein
MAAAFAKFRVGTPGSGSSHASYITRASALEPDKRRDRETPLELNCEDTSVAGALDDQLKECAFGEEPDHDADPVWTWNAPSFLTGDDNGSDESRSARAPRDVTPRDALLTEKMMAPIKSPKHEDDSEKRLPTSAHSSAPKSSLKRPREGELTTA